MEKIFKTVRMLETVHLMAQNQSKIKGKRIWKIYEEALNLYMEAQNELK